MRKPAERDESLWVPVAAPIVWSIHFTACYAFVSIWCGRFAATHGAATLYVVLVVSTLIALTAIAVLFAHGLRRRRFALPTRPHDADTPEDRQHFVAFTTMLLAGLSFVATIFETIAVFVVGTCH